MNSSNSSSRDVGIQQQNALQAETRGRQAHLERGDQIRAQQSDLAPREARGESERVEGIVGGETVAHGGDRVGNQRGAGKFRERLRVGSLHGKNLQVRARHFAVGAGAKLVSVLGQHLDGEVLQGGHQVGEHRSVAEADDSDVAARVGRRRRRTRAVRPRR